MRLSAVTGGLGSRRLLIQLLLLGLLLRVGIVLVFHDFEAPDTWEYGATARNLAAGRGFVGGGWLGPEGPTALNSPGYIVALAAALRLFGPGGYAVLELAQAVLSALLPLLAYRIALLLFDRRIAMLAFIIAVFYPPYLYFPKQITPAMATSFATAAAVLLVVEMTRQRPRARFAVLCGVAIGIATLTEGLALLVVLGLFALWWRSIGMRAIAISCLVIGLTILPWTVRNYLVFDAFVPLKTSFGLNLWLGNNPYATGTIFATDGRVITDVIDSAKAAQLAELNEAKRYTLLQREALAWIAANPGRFLELTVHRLGYYWWNSPLAELAPDRMSSPLFLYRAQLALHAPFLILGIVGVMGAFRASRQGFVALGWWLLSYTVVYATTLPNARRVRLPTEIALIILAAFGLVALWRLAATIRAKTTVAEMDRASPNPDGVPAP